MIKKFTLIMLFLFMLGIVAFSQTVSLANITASPGENKPVALNVSGFTGIGSLTFNIQFDPTVMSYTGFSLPDGVPGGFNVYASGSTLNIVGTWPSNVNFLDGKIMDLKFTYIGMTVSSLNFLGSCVVTQGVTPFYPTYTNGSVGMAMITAKAILANTIASIGGEANVDLSYENISGNVGSITQKIHYDPTKLAFVNVTGTGVFTSGVNASTNSSSGVITLTWTNTGGTNINSSLFTLKFVFNGSTTVPLEFTGGCVISDPVGDNVNIYYDNGEVSPSPFTATAVLGPVSTAVQGTIVEIPLTLTGFTSGASGGTQSFTLNLPYSTSKLDYVGLKNSVSGLTVSAASGALNLAWSDASGPNINGDFVTLKFVYKGIGAASVTFGSNCVFNTNTGTPSFTIGTVQVGYTNSTITPANADANATLGFVAGTSGTNVLVPLSFTGLPSMGALTLALTYDVNKLTFANAQNNVQNANVYETSDRVIHIAWSSTSAIDINSKFLDLQFLYNTGGGVASAAVNFADGCEFSSLSPVAIIPVNFVNGGVNFMFKVSGYLTYDSPSNKVLGNVNVYLKSGAEPVPPAVSPVPAVLYSTVTSLSTGYYEFLVPNGTYYLYAASTSTWAGVNSGDNTQLNRYISNVTPNTLNSSLRLRSADVGQNGTISSADVTAITRRISNLTPNPNFKALDWMFENPIVVVNNLDITNFNFKGLCSGDVNGSY